MTFLFQTFVRPHRGRLAVIVLTAFVAVACALAQPLIAQELIEAVRTNQTVMLTLGTLVVVILVEAVASGVHTFLLERAGAHAVFDVRRSLANRILRWPVRRYSDERQGELVSLLTTDTAQMHALLVGGVFQLVTAAALTIGACILMIVINPLLFAVTLVAIIGSGAVVGVMSDRVRALSRQSQDATAAMGSELASSLRAIRTIRTSGATEHYIDRLVEPAKRALDAMVALGNRLAVVSPVGQMATQCAFLAVLAVGAIQVAQGGMTFADLLAFLMYVVLVLSPVENAFRAVPLLQKARASWDRIVAAMEMPVEKPQRLAVGRAERAKKSAHSRVLSPSSLQFEGVTFHYPDGGTGVSDVSFTIGAGSLCALVGASGSGKSTILDLLSRLCEPDSGRILLGGSDLGTLDRHELSTRLAYMEQSAPLIDGSVAENLRLAAPEADDEQLLRSLATVGLAHLVLDDPRGLNALLGESGRDLSGGEAQRLAFARMVLSPAPIVVIDEPTSRLDPESEAQIAAVIDSFAGMRTVLVVTHRLRSVARADQVFYLRRNGTVASGTHSQLVHTSRSYSRLAQLSLAS
ncbi:ABC-type multidrug transport system fused ATPase/permease subunit [Rathayibacter agropyri]